MPHFRNFSPLPEWHTDDRVHELEMYFIALLPRITGIGLAGGNLMLSTTTEVAAFKEVDQL